MSSLTCMICTNEIYIKITLSCGHVFCYNCIKKLKRKSNIFTNEQLKDKDFMINLKKYSTRYQEKHNKLNLENVLKSVNEVMSYD